MNKFTYTTAIGKLRSLKKRKKVVQGGTWAGKTFGIIAVIIDFCIKNEERSVTVVAESVPALKNGALKDFKDIMRITGRFIEESYNGTDRKYTFSNGTTIQFDSFDSVGKAQGAGKRTDLFINEAPYIPFEIADALIGRTSGNIWIDFNPTAKFWAHDEIVGNPDSDFIILKYTDNEALPETIKNELLLKLQKAFYDSSANHKDADNIKNEYWANWCRVYIDGEIGNLEGVVFNNWRIIDNLPKDAKYTASGMDFGYTNDPTTLIDRYYLDGKRLYDEAIYQKGLLNSDIAKLAKKDFSRLIYADSAEPKSIAEIKRYGVKIYPTDKGRDSINFGIQLMQEDEFLVTARSANMIKELRHYTWQKNKSGERIGKPIDGWNHTIDSARYVETMVRSKPKVKVTRSKVA
ncbi:MAG TPA: terminase large subunit [Flavobacteriaceae bacterium]|nr:terminase large subunit [Flavobacteriaceae bacterium]